MNGSSEVIIRAVSHQLSAVSYQLSAVSRQPSGKRADACLTTEVRWKWIGFSDG
jgi:hypothetical protein